VTEVTSKPAGVEPGRAGTPALGRTRPREGGPGPGGVPTPFLHRSFRAHIGVTASLRPVASGHEQGPGRALSGPVAPDPLLLRPLVVGPGHDRVEDHRVAQEASSTWRQLRLLVALVIVAYLPLDPSSSAKTSTTGRAQCPAVHIGSVRPSMPAVSGRPGPPRPVRQPRCPTRLRKARAVSGRVSALRPQGPLGRWAVSTRTGHGVHSDGRGVFSDRGVSTRTGSGSLLAHRKGPAVCGAPVWPRATRRARRRGGRCLGATSGSGRGRPGGSAGPASPPGPASSPGG
jgi:hypothetical protein